MKYIFPLLAFSFFFLSCKSNPSSPSGTDGNNSTGIEQIFPLKAGNEWIFSVTEYSSTGAPRPAYLDTVLITGTKNYQGYTAYAMAQGMADTLLDFYKGSDLYTVSYGTPSIALHYPMNPGEIYTIQDTVSGGYVTKEILVMQSANETVTVPAGTFQAIHIDDIQIEGSISQLDTPSIRKKYFAPGVGQIKEEQYGIDQNMSRYLEDKTELEIYIIK